MENFGKIIQNGRKVLINIDSLYKKYMKGILNIRCN